MTTPVRKRRRLVVRWSRACTLLLALAATPSGAAISPVRVTLEIAPPGALGGEPREVEILARAISALGEERPSEMRFGGIEFPGTAALGLDNGHVWRLELAAEGFWAPTEILALGERSARIRAWPTGRVIGGLEVPRGEEIPGTLLVRFESVPVSASEEARRAQIEPASVECPVAEGRFACPVPAGSLDLRLRARGFVSHFRWGVEVRPGQVSDLGTLRLVPGASVAGAVVAEEGEISPETCLVALRPEVSAGVLSEVAHRRQGAGGLESRVTARGFFHFEGVAPGAYRLAVSHPGFATAEIHPVTVLPRSETALREPVLLRRPVALELFLEPPTDAFGGPWQIELARRGPMPGTLDPLGRAAADLSGSHVRRGLDPGSYVVSVFDSFGSRLAWEEIELSRESGPHFVTLDQVWVEGLLSLGGEPLEGRLTFGGRSGTHRIPMESDEEGVFGGFLPREGAWQVFVESEAQSVSKTVEVEVERGAAGVARVRIELPDTRVEGRVVDRRGRRVGEAVVKAAEAASGQVTWRTTAEDGSFRFRGLAEGTVVLDAATLRRDRESDAVVVQVSEERRTRALELVLRERARFRGRVVSSSGPVPGALVTVTPKRAGLEDHFSIRPQGVTDPTGAFDLSVPDDADRLEVVIFPPGFALTVQVLPGVPEEPLDLRVQEHGGNLLLALGGAGHGIGVPGAPSPYVVHGGVTLDAALLHRWASLKLEPNPDPSRLAVPSVAPGEYSACWFSYEALARSLARGGGSAAASQCASGYLPPYGELRLELPELGG